MNLCLIHSTKLILFLVLVIHYRLSPENLRKRITVQNAIAKIHPLSPLSPPKPHSCSKLSLKWWRYIGTVFIIPPHHSAENDRLVMLVEIFQSLMEICFYYISTKGSSNLTLFDKVRKSGDGGRSGDIFSNVVV